MADYGLQVFGEDGNLWFDSTENMVRVVDYFLVDTPNGSRHVPGLGQNGFFIVSGFGGTNASAGKWGESQPPFLMQKFHIDGDTLRWEYDYEGHYHFRVDEKERSQIYVTVILFR